MGEVPPFSSKELKNMIKSFMASYLLDEISDYLQHFGFTPTMEYKPGSLTPISIRFKSNCSVFNVSSDFHFCYNYIYFM